METEEKAVQLASPLAATPKAAEAKGVKKAFKGFKGFLAGLVGSKSSKAKSANSCHACTDFRKATSLSASSSSKGSLWAGLKRMAGS